MGTAGAINLGNADVYGKAATGAGGGISVGSNGGVGSRDWQSSHPGQIQPGWSSSDMNVFFPDVVAPFSSGMTPASDTVGGQSYAYVLGRGDYYLSSLSLSGKNSLIVTDNARLRVDGSISLAGQATIIIATNASLTLYANGPVDLSGNGLANNNTSATNFFFYGMTNNTSITLSGNGTLTGVIYAPNADFSLKGGGNSDQDFVGASVTKSVTMNGHFKFHYDEALSRLGSSGAFQITSWNEI